MNIQSAPRAKRLDFAQSRFIDTNTFCFHTLFALKFFFTVNIDPVMSVCFSGISDPL